jgi:hypothetical protein
VSLQARFRELLEEASAELYADNADLMSSGQLLPTENPIDDADLELFFAAVDEKLVSLHRGGRFNTLDRPKPDGRWSLLSRSKDGGWYNAEYLPQLAAYADLVLRLGYPPERVLFELPARSLQLDLAVLDDAGRVVVLGEAKRDNRMLDKLHAACLARFSDACPDDTSKKRGDEARQLSWRLWTVAPEYTWLIGPGRRDAYRTQTSPLRLTPIAALPAAEALGLSQPPPEVLQPPDLASH